ncbi:MAG TPA: diguanylate cyclase [Trichocoleus sp.]
MSSAFNPADCLLLVVDDVPNNLKVVGNILAREGYVMTYAINGQQALERLEASTPDLILLDLMMPGMSGIEVCRTIKANPNQVELPIIFLTASQEQKHLVEAFEAGAIDYVVKPFQAPELLARVKTHLKLKHTTDQLRQALSEVEKLACIDPLTNTFNRRRLFQLAEQELLRTQRYGSPLSVMMLDVDHFKAVNDTYGHLAGDWVLKEVAETTRRQLRSTDFLGRYGGEEFAVILTETDGFKAVEVGERIRSKLESLAVVAEGHAIKVTVSIGVGSYMAQTDDIDQIIKRADLALYHSKNSGRNACSIFAENACELYRRSNRDEDVANFEDEFEVTSQR